MAEISVVALFLAQPGEGDTVEPMLVRYAEKAHEEAGCRLYSLQRGATDPDQFFVVEKWRSEEEFEQHLRGDTEVFEIWGRMEPLLAADPKVIVALPVGAGMASKFEY